MPSRPPLSPSAISAHALAGANCPRFSEPSGPSPVYQTILHADAYAPLFAALPPKQQSFASHPAPVPSTIVAPAVPQSVQPLPQSVVATVALVPSTVAVFPAPPPVAQLSPQAITAVQLAARPPAKLSQLPTPTAAQPASFAADWIEKNAYRLLKLSGRARFVESSNNKIREFIAD